VQATHFHLSLPILLFVFKLPHYRPNVYLACMMLQ
jgi:hypothetical protein